MSVLSGSALPTTIEMDDTSRRNFFAFKKVSLLLSCDAFKSIFLHSKSATLPPLRRFQYSNLDAHQLTFFGEDGKVTEDEV